MPSFASPPPSGRLPTLDALRGVFALIVFAHHLVLALVPDVPTGLLPALRDTPLAAFMAGRAPVIVFFVLSGFVLMLPFRSRRRQGYGSYAVRRFARIYIPFFCSIMLAAALYALAGPRPVPSLTDWFNTASWDAPPQPLLILKHLAMTGRPEDMRLNSVMWSLVHEMRISLAFPLIAMLALRSRMLALAMAVLCYWGGLHGARMVAPDGLAASLLDTLRFSAFFMIGAVLALHLDALRAWAAGLGRMGLAATMAGIVCLLSLKPSPLAEPLFASAATGAIALAIGARQAQAVLAAAPLRWLGRVSFSLYLVHLPVMLAVYHGLDGVVGMAAATGVAVVLVLLASELFHRCFEEPSMAFGRRLSGSTGRSARIGTALREDGGKGGA